ncbi:MAG: hypothetical protein ACYCQJ_16200 [Nitrososphaerales archaeon]
MFFDIHLVVDTVFFVSIALILGYLMDLLIPPPDRDETFGESLAWLYIQLGIGIILLFLVDQLYTFLTGTEADAYYGFDIYGVIFFLVQEQLRGRIAIIFRGLDKVFMVRNSFNSSST